MVWQRPRIVSTVLIDNTISLHVCNLMINIIHIIVKTFHYNKRNIYIYV